jgi:MerR family copper efflux transcriptional regulator
MLNQTMSTSQLAAAGGVGVQTVRYYEREGLLADPNRTAAGHRQYDREHLRQLRFIRKAQGLGFQLDEIREILDLRVDANTRCGEVADAADRVIRRIDAKMATLSTMWTALRKLRQSCERAEPVDGCPILAALQDDEP